ncbi:sulfonate ABC transporter ATP-binding protein [Haematobacter massiliensis]|uniref:Sulfonate ABC transporter ATP-binding protein n=1 Tax=Haematobacter massiliensis TaxID=195105 RepID=A0A086Y6M3_9RHOB|nr:ABC transporter ATP-binding protein [Haematobacter massiliensis]KFI29923.1 sulfonate ABC transporter ATP-binding protein [Haematobacter massiliensis]OWJ72939.1 sulfonate ABC transporter ATP-binding protein [Haematobacter massiliensis]OWJ88418.1 sulfonate ABC transporter ATP-binding protein [Haematobacter massiliensis]QBJ25430.1 ABC transporter ATP-binding protein [Haematobacter massiliensis]
MADTLTLPRPRTAAGEVALHGVSRSFRAGGREVQALRDVSLTVAAGEFLAIVGPSGCGKSTLLRLIAGLDRPDAGHITLDGAALAGPGLDRGIVFQDHRLLPWLSVERNIALALRSLPGPEAEKTARVAELIALVGLRGFEAALPHQLSGGMSQRAAIARALAPRPPVLLLDEPLGALDSLTRARLQEELLAIWERESSTVVLITHDVEEALVLASRVVIMEPRPGRIGQEVAVPLPRPRRREDPAFVALRQRISARLHGI